MYGFLLLSLLVQYPFTVFALTLPILTNLTAESTLTKFNLNAEAHCAKGPATSHLPFSRDCVKAVRLLPQSIYIGTFRISSGESLWRLPVSKSYRSCKVLVTLNEDFDIELGSWFDVCVDAIQLLHTWQLPPEEAVEEKTGGWTTSGAENGLVVELIRSTYGAENLTDNGTEGPTDAVRVE